MSASTLPAMSTATSSPLSTRMLNKVPEVTVFFWIIKVLCTTTGETFADYVNETLGFGLVNTTYVTGALLAVLLLAQFRVRRYVPALYWACVVVISVFGTLITDNLTDGHDVPLTTTTPIFAAILALVFAVWFAVERTLSMHSIVTTRREGFYWLAILFTFALGTAAGDLVGEKAGLGYGVSVLLWAGVIAVIAAARYGVRLQAVLAFWLAYILTRPLGASIGDKLTADKADGGLGISATLVSYVFLAIILALVGYLTVSNVDRTPPEKIDAPAP